MNMKSGFMFEPPGDADDLERPSLRSLPRGARGRVELVEADGLDRERLEVMGLCPGRTVEVVQAGDPMIVRVLGTRIGLAGSLAATIRVRVEA
jgi:Fe2+ transport system protein FeoA